MKLKATGPRVKSNQKNLPVIFPLYDSDLELIMTHGFNGNIYTQNVICS